MRSRRRTPKGGVQAEKQQQYVRLIAQGVNSAEACRIVGINRKTGNRWRYGRSIRNSAGVLVHYAPVKITEAKARSPRYLSEQERIVIADLLCAKMTVRGITERLGRSPSTISREIRRNSGPRRPLSPAPCRACSPRPRRQASNETDRRRRGPGRGCRETVGEALEPRAGRARAARAVRRPARALAVCRVRSIRRSMTRRSPSPARHVVVAADVCSACSDEAD